MSGRTSSGELVPFFVVAGVLVLAALSGCADEGLGMHLRPGQPRVGDTRFVSAAPGGMYNSLAGGVEDGTAAPSNERQEGSEREIEEADVIRVSGNLLYVLNAYRGLEIIDIQNPDQPVILGSAKVFGYPVEMYIDGTRAYVVVSNYFSYWRNAESDADADEWRGSQVVVVDIANPALPTLIGGINIEGYVSDTRRVGDVLYVVSNRYAWYSCSGSDDTVNLTFVASIDIWDPADIHEVERQTFPGASNFIHVTQNAIFVAQYDWAWDDVTQTSSYGSTVFYVDIADAAGDIAVRDSFAVPGYLRDRYAMDWYEGSFRIVTHFWEGIGHSELRTFDTTNPDAVVPQGLLRIEDAGQLMATRFSADRAYTIHLPQTVDPLDVIDLSDPYHPTLEAVLEIPGWVNHLEVRGYRLIALGVDDTAWPRRVSVKLFDVTEAHAPVLLDEVPIGDGYSWSQASWDPKALSILDDAGLILIPYTSWAADAGAYARGVATVSWLGDDLAARGVMPTRGYVHRTRVVTDRALALSYDFLEVFDVSNLDQPLATAALELAWNVADLVVLGDVTVQLIGDYWWYGDVARQNELRVIGKNDPDTGPVLARLPVVAPYGRLFVHQSSIYLASYDWEADVTRVSVFDFTDPYAPVARGSVEIDSQGGFDYWGGLYGYWSWWWYSGGEILQLGDRLVLHPMLWWWGCYDLAAEGGGEADAAAEPIDTLWVVDLGTPDQPVATAVSLPHFASQVSGQADTVYYTYFEPVTVEESPYTWAAFYLGRVVLDPYTGPRRLSGVNIPGQFISASANGQTVFTLNSRWNDDGTLAQSFHSLRLQGSAAELLDTLELALDNNSWLNGLAIRGETAFVATERWGSYACDDPPELELSLIDVGTPTSLEVASTFSATGYGYLMGVEAGRAFLNMGWGEGMIVLDVTDATAPALLGGFRTQGYPTAVRIDDDVVYLPSGYYGVQMFRLSDATPL
jgi:hypothetical protein